MSKSFVVNASPLILFSRIGRLDLLVALADTLEVPAAVMAELQAGAHHDDAAEVVRGVSAIRIVPDLEVAEEVKAWRLGPGESQVLSHALRSGENEAVLDDRAARRCAQSLGIALIGTLGVVIKCRHLGLIPAARPIVESLSKAGIRLVPALLDAALEEVGE